MDKRESGVFYRSFYEAGKCLTEEQRGKYYTLIFEYMFDFSRGESDDPIVNAMFLLIAPQVEANIKKYFNGKEPKTQQDESKSEAKDKQDESKAQGNVDVYDDVYDDADEKTKCLVVKKDNVEEIKRKYKELIGAEEVEKHAYRYGTLFELMQTGYKVLGSKKGIEDASRIVSEYVILNGVVGPDGNPKRDVAMGYAKKMRLRCEENKKTTLKHMSRFSKFLSDYKKTNVTPNK